MEKTAFQIVVKVSLTFLLQSVQQATISHWILHSNIFKNIFVWLFMWMLSGGK